MQLILQKISYWINQLKEEKAFQEAENQRIKQEIENQRIEESLRAMQQNSDEIKVIKEKALLIQQLLNARQQGE